MTRPYSWYPLATTDPVPGDPDLVRAAGAHYGAVAAAIGSAAKQLRTLTAHDGTVSEAVAAIQESSRTVADEITTAQGRYQAVGDALVAYAQGLAQAQTDSALALQAAQSAQHAVDDASASVARAASTLGVTLDPEERVGYQRSLDGAHADWDAGDVSLARARQDLELATQRRDRAARTAITSIEGTTQSDDLNDGWWENWGSKVAHAVSVIAGAISAIAGIAALFLAWVPVVGELLAAISLIALAVATIADIALLIGGDGSWTAVGLDLLGFATFGAGRIAGAALKISAEGAGGAARAAAGSAAAMSPAVRGAAGLSTASSAERAIGEMAPDVSSLSRGAATAAAKDAAALATRKGVGQLFEVVRPGAVLRDLGATFSKAGAFVKSGDSVGGLVSEGRIAAGAALHGGVRSGVSALFAGDAQAAGDFVKVSSVSPGLGSLVGQYRHTVTIANVVTGGTAAVVTADRAVLGVSTWMWCDDNLGRSPAAIALNLN